MLLSLPLVAWGDKGHRAVSALALQSLPDGARAWFRGQEREVGDHSSDPDHWRQDRKEGPRHYLNVEAYGDPTQVPHTLEEARTQIGGDVARTGVVPWIIQDRWNGLVSAFRKGTPADIALATAVLGHYIADIHVPLHTTRNHDGQFTHQKGVHSRWESGLVERYVRMEALASLPAKADPAFLQRPWDWLAQAHGLVPQLLEDDREADRTTPLGPGGKRRTQAYWLIFWAKQGPVVQQQLQLAGEHLGDAIFSAWVTAGRPVAPLQSGI